jgi:hypothetical protein
VQVNKHLSDAFPIQNGLREGEAFSPLLLNFATEYTMKKVEGNKEELELNGANEQLADGIY